MTAIKALSIAGLLLVLALPAAASAVEPEDLLGISFDFEKKEVTVVVVSKGCTEKGHFAFEMKSDVLTISRKAKDECKAMPDKKSLSFSWKEAGIDPNKPFRVGNKFIANENTANMR